MESNAPLSISLFTSFLQSPLARSALGCVITISTSLLWDLPRRYLHLMIISQSRKLSKTKKTVWGKREGAAPANNSAHTSFSEMFKLTHYYRVYLLHLAARDPANVN